MYVCMYQGKVGKTSIENAEYSPGKTVSNHLKSSLSLNDLIKVISFE